MADSGTISLQSGGNYKKPTPSSFFSSPRLLTSFASSFNNETETTIMSPTSILDTNRPFSAFKNPFWSETNSPRTPPSSAAAGGEPKRHYWDSRGVVGLGLVDSLLDDDSGNEARPETRTVVFGSHLKIQIPTKTTPFGSAKRVFSGCLSEMELSEEYTRVISRGPNPRTTHIFDNCVIESTSCFEVGGGDGFSSSPAPASETGKDGGFVGVGVAAGAGGYPSESFLSFCFYCKKNLEEGKDIFMYRGERAFCSRECRYQGMLMEEDSEKLGSEDISW